MNNNHGGCGCNRNNNEECNNCIQEILQVINILQSNACPENCLNSCDRPALGGGGSCITCNTRPIQLFTCCGNGVPLSMPASRSSVDGETSSVFRVEKIDGCCCTCRVLVPNTDTTSAYPFAATDSLFTIDTNCVCAIRCLNDTFVDCVC